MNPSIELREPKGRVTVMPDFYLDRLLKVQSLDSFWKSIFEKAESGGGNVIGRSQAEVKGGNAVNLAYALGRLGVRTYLLTVADRFGRAVLDHAMSGLPVRVKTAEGRQGYTLALEFLHGGRLVNVMFNDTGTLRDFGPEKLGHEDWTEIAGSSVVAILNWAVNLKGLDLVKAIFSFAKERGVLTFLDPSDITIRRGTEFKEVLDLARNQGYPEVLSVNENEARGALRILGLESLPPNYSLEDVGKAGDLLSRELGITVDLHTPLGSSSTGKSGKAQVWSLKVEQRVSTGAGDSWNAGDILGYLSGMGPEERLVVANACGALFVSGGETPTREELSRFLSEMGT